MKCCRLSENSSKWSQILAVLSGSLLAVTTGMHTGWPSPSIPKLLENDLQFKITDSEVSIVVMIAPLGCVVGSPVSGILLDTLGRKRTLLLLSIPYIISWLLIAVANSTIMLLIARFLVGISDGAAFTCLPIYLGEVLQPKIRGTFGISQSTGILLGLLVINAYGSFVSIRSAAYISLTVPLLFLATFTWMPESPYYLLGKERITEARKALQQLRLMENVENELNQIHLDVQRQLSEPCRFKDIFIIPTNLKGFLILLGLRIFQQLSGITAIGFYIQMVLGQTNSGLSPAVSAIIVAATQVTFLIAVAPLFDVFGRRPLLISSYIASIIDLVVLGSYFYLEQCGYDLASFSWLPITTLVIYSIVTTLGVLPMPSLMAGELLSSSVKSKALGLKNIVTGVLASASAIMFHWLNRDFGTHAPFFVFASFCGFGALFCICYVPETKGKTLEEIQQYLKGNQKTNRQ